MYVMRHREQCKTKVTCFPSWNHPECPWLLKKNRKSLIDEELDNMKKKESQSNNWNARVIAATAKISEEVSINTSGTVSISPVKTRSKQNDEKIVTRSKLKNKSSNSS